MKTSFNFADYVFSRAQAAEGAHEFYNPSGVSCGVYLVLDPRKRECVYVGSSSQLSNRLRNSDHMPPTAPTFSFSVPKDYLRDVEACYWIALQPRINFKSPPGMELDGMVNAIRAGWPAKLARRTKAACRP